MKGSIGTLTGQLMTWFLGLDVSSPYGLLLGLDSGDIKS
jgi:hypothetical protein